MKPFSMTRRDFVRLGTGSVAAGIATKVAILEPTFLRAAPAPASDTCLLYTSDAADE